MVATSLLVCSPAAPLLLLVNQLFLSFLLVKLFITKLFFPARRQTNRSIHFLLSTFCLDFTWSVNGSEKLVARIFGSFCILELAGSSKMLI